MRNHQCLNLLLLLTGIMVFLYFSFKFFDFTIDDSFIAYRYAENLALGYGFSWNYDETQEFGFTSYFMILIIALGIKLGFDPILFSKVVTISAGIITIVISGFMIRILTQNKMKFYFLPSLFLGLVPAFGLHAVSGMETLLFTMFFSLSILSYMSYIQSPNSKKVIPFILFVILATITRYEGIILVLGMIIHQIYLKIILKNNIELKKIILFCSPIGFLV